jgi:hypothetical protein
MLATFNMGAGRYQAKRGLSPAVRSYILRCWPFFGAASAIQGTKMTSTLPALHSSYVDRVTQSAQADPRIQALLGGGSLVHGGFDAHSDLDFVLVVADADFAAAMRDRHVFAQGLGGLLSAFTGEHVGEPRLLICLYGPPLIHVDLKWVTPADLDRRIERPQVIWARDPGAVTARLSKADIAWPNQTPQWFEDRAWIWLHYGATKLRRGELYEAISMLSFFREQVLGPMLSRRAGGLQRGVRRIEAMNEVRLKRTLAGHDAEEVATALTASMELYLDLRADDPPPAAVEHMPEALIPFMQASSRVGRLF